MPLWRIPLQANVEVDHPPQAPKNPNNRNSVCPKVDHRSPPHATLNPNPNLTPAQTYRSLTAKTTRLHQTQNLPNPKTKTAKRCPLKTKRDNEQVRARKSNANTGRVSAKDCASGADSAWKSENV